MYSRDIYDYREEMINDIISYIEDENLFNEFETPEALEEYLNDELWAVDSVTGNASGSYWCNAYFAEKALAGNWDLLADACEEFGCTSDALRRGPEFCDVTVRCYLLGECVSCALNKIEDRICKAEEDEEEG